MATAHPRESACPVHFVWEGRGAGRPLVRLGFLGLTAWGAAFSLVEILHLGAAFSPLLAGLVPVAVVYLGGQLLSLRDRLRH
jgi:hypothetical protein